MWLIGLLQKQPQHFRLDGPTRLKFTQDLTERKIRSHNGFPRQRPAGGGQFTNSLHFARSSRPYISHNYH
ncbi:transcription-repair coupling factor [Enterobacter cloacae]|nr:transcription-repair coupling factor [Enterobacter cloacae]